MKRIRVIPSLLLENGRLVKTEKFGQRTYVGDPINTVRLFNDKEVDELVLLDIMATRSGKGPDVGLVREIGGECFMPIAYGGGISTLDQAREVFDAGVEKIIVNAALFSNPGLVSEIAGLYGSQAVVASIDVRPRRLRKGYDVVTHGGTKTTGIDPVDAAKAAVEAGAGEIMICNTARDGTRAGYDLALTLAIADAVPVPVISSGGAGSLDDFVEATRDGHASAVAAGAMFVFKGPHRAVLVNYPNQDVLKANVYDLL